MLNRLPKFAGNLPDLLADIGNPKPAAIAKALDVSERTVQRWMRTGAPRTALLSLWWLSREGHSVWDAEMFNRTQLALATNKALWRLVKENRLEAASQPSEPVTTRTATTIQTLRRA